MSGGKMFNLIRDREVGNKLQFTGLTESEILIIQLNKEDLQKGREPPLTLQCIIALCQRPVWKRNTAIHRDGTAGNRRI